MSTGRTSAFAIRDGSSTSGNATLNRHGQPMSIRGLAKQRKEEFQRNFPIYLEKARLIQAEVCRLNNARIETDGWKQLLPHDLSRYIKGSVAPDIDRIRQIAEILGIEPVDLVPSYNQSANEFPAFQVNRRMSFEICADGMALVEFSGKIDAQVAKRICDLLSSEILKDNAK